MKHNWQYGFPTPLFENSVVTLCRVFCVCKWCEIGVMSPGTGKAVYRSASVKGSINVASVQCLTDCISLLPSGEALNMSFMSAQQC